MRGGFDPLGHGTRADANQRELTKYASGYRTGTAHRGTPRPCAEGPRTFSCCWGARRRRRLHAAWQDDSYRSQSLFASIREARLVRLEASLKPPCMKSRVLLGAAACLTLAGCAIRQAPIGED